MGLVMPMDLFLAIGGVVVAIVIIAGCAYLVGEIDGQNNK